MSNTSRMSGKNSESLELLWEKFKDVRRAKKCQNKILGCIKNADRLSNNQEKILYGKKICWENKRIFGKFLNFEKMEEKNSRMSKKIHKIWKKSDENSVIPTYPNNVGNKSWKLKNV